MPINGAVLGAQIVAAIQPPDPLGIAGWMAIGGVFASWSMTAIVNPLGGTPLIAVGPVVTGTGVLVPGPVPALGMGLAAASGAVADPVAVAKWMLVAAEAAKWMLTGGVNPLTLIAYASPIPPTGPVSGVAQLVFSGGPADLATAVGATDAAGIAKWTAVATAWKTHLETLGLVQPTMTNPGVGGPLTGTGAIS